MVAKVKALANTSFILTTLFLIRLVSVCKSSLALAVSSKVKAFAIFKLVVKTEFSPTLKVSEKGLPVVKAGLSVKLAVSLLLNSEVNAALSAIDRVSVLAALKALT